MYADIYMGVHDGSIEILLQARKKELQDRIQGRA
jgi:hypothetical protein